MTQTEYHAKKLDIYNQQIAICREYGLDGLLRYTEKPQHIELQQAKPKRKPKWNLKPHQQILLAICRLIVK